MARVYYSFSQFANTQFMKTIHLFSTITINTISKLTHQLVQASNFQVKNQIF